MVKSTITSLGRTGLKDWFLQRLSAIILLVYTLFIVIYIVSHNGFDYSDWHALYACGWMKAFTLLALLSLIAHSWVGVWTIFTDYIKNGLVMGLLQTLAILSYVLVLFWVIRIIWAIN